VRPGREWAIRAPGGSLRRRRSTACVVRILSLPGWMTVIRSELVVAEVRVVGVTKCLEAAVSINAVEDKSGGLVQPESR
jgi:hypothetical protein